MIIASYDPETNTTAPDADEAPEETTSAPKELTKTEKAAAIAEVKKAAEEKAAEEKKAKAAKTETKAEKAAKADKPAKEPSDRKRGEEYAEHRIYEGKLPDGKVVQKRTKLKVGFTHLLVGKDPQNKGAWKAIRFSCSEARLLSDVKRIEAMDTPRYTEVSITDKVKVTDKALEKPKKEKGEKKTPAKKAKAKAVGEKASGKSTGYQTKRQAIAAAKKVLGLTGKEALEAPKKKGDVWVLPKAKAS